MSELPEEREPDAPAEPQSGQPVEQAPREGATPEPGAQPPAEGAPGLEPSIESVVEPPGVSAKPAEASQAEAKAVRPVRKRAKPHEPAPTAIWGTGRRKKAVARVRLVPGSGSMLINRRTCESYFPREPLRLVIRGPLTITHQLGKYDVLANVQGGGPSGQAGAIRLGIARALVKLDAACRGTLRAAGFLTRDQRMRERKKYGLKGARKRFQWTKR